MIFKDSDHESSYAEISSRMKCLDEYHRAAAYLLSLDSVCRQHSTDIFDFQEDLICPESLRANWQTGTSRKTSRLLFNLWNGYNAEGEPIEDETASAYYTPEQLFSCSYAPYYWQAIRIRFPDYTETVTENASPLCENALRLAAVLERYSDQWGIIHQMSLRLNYDREQLLDDIHALYEYVSEKAELDRQQDPE